MLNDGVNAYTYNPSGNVATRTGFSFVWSDEDKLRSISGGVTASYRYDFKGRRTIRTVAGATNNYLYDGLNLIRETGATPADYLFGPGIDEPLAMVRGGQAYYYATDALGSVNLMTNASGAVQRNYLYDAWGQTRSQTGSLANPFGYTAREFGEASGLFYRARQYAPGIGRFLSEDPLPTWLGRDQMTPDQVIDAYRYIGNDPVFGRDPLGLKKCGDKPAPTGKCIADCHASMTWKLCLLHNAGDGTEILELIDLGRDWGKHGPTGILPGACSMTSSKTMEHMIEFAVRDAYRRCSNDCAEMKCMMGPPRPPICSRSYPFFKPGWGLH